MTTAGQIIAAVAITTLLLTGLALIGYAIRNLARRAGVFEYCGERYSPWSVIYCDRPRGHTGHHADDLAAVSWPPIEELDAE